MVTVLPWVLAVAAALFALVSLAGLVRALVDLVARVRTENEH